MRSETALVCYVVDVSVNAVGIFVSVGQERRQNWTRFEFELFLPVAALNFPGSRSLLVSVLSVAPAVVHVVPKPVWLVMAVMVVVTMAVVTIVTMALVMARQGALNVKRTHGAEQKDGHALLQLNKVRVRFM